MNLFELFILLVNEVPVDLGIPEVVHEDGNLQN